MLIRNSKFRMFRTLLTIIFSLLIISSFSQEIKLKGIYQGDNLYVMNPFSSSGVGFCIQEVRVNNRVSTDEIASSAFEIDFSQYHLKMGSPIEVIIKHKEGCIPKVLNPNVIQAKSTFRISKIEVGRDKVLRWASTNETGALDFIVEQHRWNKWVKIGVVKGKGGTTANKYAFKISPHSGQNKFRVKQVDHSKKARYSPNAIYRAMTPQITFKKSGNTIKFSRATMYEIYDYYGNIVKKGNADSVDITKLKAGNYFLNYDNKMDTFKKK